MPVPRAFSLLTDLRTLDQRLVTLSCPSCGSNDPHPVWRRDRYFLRVNLSVCRGCGLVYLARGLQGDVQASFYEQVYPRLMVQPPSDQMLWNYRLIAGYRHSEITSVIGAIESVLDVGAGLGFFLAACRSNGCEQYLGLEPGGPQRDHAVHTLGLGDKVRAQGLNASTQLPFKPQLITLFHVLEHLEEPGKALQWLAGLIDPQGWLVIEVPDMGANWPGLGLWQIHVSHRSYFCAQTLEALLRNNGFSVHRICREAHGIYEGNLRVYARPGAQAVTSAPLTPQRLTELTAHIHRQIRPLSLRNGYPRAAMRLGKLSLKGR